MFKLKIILAIIIGITIMITPLILLPSEKAMPKTIAKDRTLMQGLQMEALQMHERENETRLIEEYERAFAINSITTIALTSILSLIPAFIISIYIKKKME